VFGWQRPCYLLVDEGYAPTFKSLIEETDWRRYGTGSNPKCADCMAHCGYEATAVNDTINHPLKALRVFSGPKTDGPSRRNCRSHLNRSSKTTPVPST
jgi:hypothetical protein